MKEGERETERERPGGLCFHSEEDLLEEEGEEEEAADEEEGEVEEGEAEEGEVEEGEEKGAPAEPELEPATVTPLPEEKTTPPAV